MKKSGRKSNDFKKSRPNTPHLHSSKGQATQEKHLKIAPKHPGKGRA